MLHFACFHLSFLVSAKLDNNFFPWARWVAKCLFCFGCEYHFPYQISARAGKRWRIISLGLAGGGVFLSFALSSRSFHSIPAHPLVLSIWSLLKGKGQGYLSMAFFDFTTSSFSSLLLCCFPGRAHLGFHFIIAKC